MLALYYDFSSLHYKSSDFPRLSLTDSAEKDTFLLSISGLINPDKVETTSVILLILLTH